MKNKKQWILALIVSFCMIWIVNSHQHRHTYSTSIILSEIHTDITGDALEEIAIKKIYGSQIYLEISSPSVKDHLELKPLIKIPFGFLQDAFIQHYTGMKNMISEDMNQDGLNDIIVFLYDPYLKKSIATLYTYNSKKKIIEEDNVNQ